MNVALQNLKPGLEGQRVDALRDREEGTEVSTLELFFDLVYVFAITQLSHLLLEDLTWRGALQTGILTVAIWWVWIDTTWITNWFDPHRLPVRLMLIGLMGMSLVMSAAIPEAWHGRAEWFAIAYVIIQVGRSGLCLFMLGKNEQAENFSRITLWAVLTAPLWLAGGFAEGDTQLLFWLAAVLIDSSAPALGYRVPGLGASSTAVWTISGGHLAERCQLFVIIALGESILLIGGTLANEKELTTAVALAFAITFSTSVMMWWVYFSRAGKAAEIFEHSKNPGGMGRAYTYFHIPMIAGIISMAVAAEKVIAHPTGHVKPELTAVAVGGACLYMFGNAVFNSRITHAFPRRRTITLLAIAAVIPFAQFLTPILLMAWIITPLICLATLDGVTKPPPYRDESGEPEEDIDFAEGAKTN
ncbi:MAG: low temperature requirement protein A [Solirubrobacterales bacterium]